MTGFTRARMPLCWAYRYRSISRAVVMGTELFMEVCKTLRGAGQSALRLEHEPEASHKTGKSLPLHYIL